MEEEENFKKVNIERRNQNSKREAEIGRRLPGGSERDCAAEASRSNVNVETCERGFYAASHSPVLRLILRTQRSRDAAAEVEGWQGRIAARPKP